MDEQFSGVTTSLFMLMVVLVALVLMGYGGWVIFAALSGRNMPVGALQFGALVLLSGVMLLMSMLAISGYHKLTPHQAKQPLSEPERSPELHPSPSTPSSPPAS